MEFYKQEYQKWINSSILSEEEKNELTSILDN